MSHNACVTVFQVKWPALETLCYAQIGGLAVATFITLLLVPVFYSAVRSSELRQ